MTKFSGLLLGALVIAGAGCKKKSHEPGAAGSAAGGAGGGEKLPPLTADPDPGTITPKDLPPFESVKFRMLAKRDDTGWPNWDLYNLGTKPIAFVAIYAYAYDASGKQLARTSVPLSWNGKLDPGGKTDFSADVGGDQLTAAAVSFDACYGGIKFDGAADQIRDDNRCPDQKPKGK
ncbi:MAG TPA: FxLYD domain-containing protein [Kofleriaceae bacterium]|jgi:hypothetical protein